MGKAWLLLMVFLICLPLGLGAWEFKLSPQCTVCVEGMVVNTTLEIRNTGAEALKVSRLTLADSSGVIFFTSPMQAEVAVKDSVIASFPLHLPPASRGSTLFYKPCIDLPEGVSCAESYARMFIKPLTELECSADKDCAEDSVCKNFKCARFSCASTPKNHKCPTFGAETILGIVIVGLLIVILLVLLLIRRG